jgi:hypothetical protein
MQKTYCDLCGEELKVNSFIGGLMRLRQSQQLDPAQALKNPEIARILEGNPGLQQTVEKELWDLCENCQRWLWVEAAKHQEELKNLSK